jgi:hypothetical protein
VCAVCSSESLASTHEFTRRYNPEEQHRNTHRRESQISHECEEVAPLACKETQEPPNSDMIVNSHQVLEATGYVFTHVG